MGKLIYCTIVISIGLSVLHDARTFRRQISVAHQRCDGAGNIWGSHGECLVVGRG